MKRTSWSYFLFIMITFSLLLVACSGNLAKTSVSSWPTSTPEEQGIDSQSLIKMLDYIEPSFTPLHSFLVLRHGVLVMEVYYPPYGPQDKHMQFSATKSFTSALVGIAVSEGFIKSVGQPALDYFPGITYANPSEQKKNIHIHDLLNMTSGLTADDNDLGEAKDGVQFTFDLPMGGEPGTYFEYNSGNSHLLSAIVQKTTGKLTSEYAREKLFEPLGITDVYWETDPSGITRGNVGLMLAPRDMAKFGQLYLQKGQWNGKQVVPAEWVAATIKPNEYAYQWWNNATGYAAMGYAGQIIYVIPEKDLVVVSTADITDPAYAVNIAENFIVPAIKSDQSLPASPASKQLAEKIKAIANPQAQEVPALPAIASSVNGKTLRLEENPLGWKTTRLDFKGKQAWLTVTSATFPEAQKFEIGLDERFRKTAVKKVEKLAIPKPSQRMVLNPYQFSILLGAPLDGSVAMKGKWMENERFLLTIQDVRDYDLNYISFQFTPPSVTIQWMSVMDGIYDLPLAGKME